MSTLHAADLYHRLSGPSDSPKPGIIFIHGLMGFAANWGKIAPYFENNRKVLVYDQRGHGRSTKPPSGYTPTDYASDLKELVNELKLGPCHIVGHSMGGRVALRFCHLYPQSAVSLCLEDSGVVAKPERQQWIETLLKEVPTPFANKEEAKLFFAKHYAHDPITGGFLHANLELKPEGFLDWRFHKLGMIETIRTGRALSAWDEYKGLGTPTLIIRGERSKEFTKEEAETMARGRAKVYLETIENAGHYVHAEQPKAFLEKLDSFVSNYDS